MLKSYNKRYYHLLLGFLLWFPQFANAQKYLFDIQYLSIKDGLPRRSARIWDQDKDGYIWGASTGLIFRYDGYEFDEFKNVDLGIANEVSLYFQIDENGNVWYVDGAGKEEKSVRILNPSTRTHQLLSDYLKDKLPPNFKNNALAFVKDPKLGFVFVTKDGKFYSYHKEEVKLIYQHHTAFGLEPTQEMTHHTNVVIQETGDFWFYHKDTVFHVAPDQPLAYVLAPNPVIELFKMDGDIFIVSGELTSPSNRGRDYFAKIENGKFVRYDLEGMDSHQKDVRFAIRSDRLGFKYYFNDVEGDKILTCLTPKNKIIFQQPLAIEGTLNDLHNLFIDQQDNLWGGTPSGIFKITRRKVPFIPYLEGYSTRGIFRLGNQLHINTWSAHGMPLRAIASLDTLGKVDFKSTSLIQYAFCKEDNYLWAGSNENLLYRQDIKTGETTIFSTAIEKRLLLPYQSKNTNHFWIGTSAGLVLFDKVSATFKTFKSSSEALNTANFFSVFENEEGIWWSTDKGLFLLDNDGNVLKTLDKTSGFRADQMNYIHQDSDGLYWIGTRGNGLIRWNKETDEKIFIGRKQGLLNENIYTIFEDSDSSQNHFLWMPTDYGLVRFNKETFEVNTYLPEHGLLHEEFNTYSYHQDEEGNFYFGGLGGVIGFHPRDIVGNTNEDVPLHFNAFKILKNNETDIQDVTSLVETQKSLIIQPNDKLFEVYFSLMDFKKKDKLYGYKIEGYDKDWNYTTDNFIRINSLPYGTYQLKVRGQIDGTTWTKQSLTMTIQVMRPFYLTIGFMVSVIVLIGLGFWFFTRYRSIQYKRNKEKLEQTIAERTAQIAMDKQVIEEQAEALKELDKAKTNFFSNITHEFRTPLTLIIGPVQQIAEEVSSSFLKKRLRSVGKNAQQLLNLINQLLDISKLESGQMKVEIQHGDIISYTQSLFDGLRPLSEQKQQTMRFFTNQTVWKTYFDEKKWQKIIINLLSNAIKYTAEGGTVQLCLTQTTIANRDMIHLAIQDNGIGITEENKAKLFNRFYQIDGSSTRVQEGTGIGLALVKELIELQGGTISVHSQIGKGTTFEVQLPVLEATPAPTMPTTTIEPTLEEALILPNVAPTEALEIPVSNNTEKLDLLIIEDNTEMREYISFCLDTSKYNIIAASDGEEGIQKALATIPDLIISDVMMPKKDGFEVIEAIRNDISTSHIPLVLLTAKTALESRLKAFERGADAYLTKPFSPKELALRIRKLIEIRQSLQLRYQNGQHQTDDENKEFTQEDKFITDLNTYILDHLREPDLNGVTIGKHFGLSRTSLYRKLKALTNQSVTEFIRIQRLTKAVELLHADELTISEVAYEVGFSSLSYFSRAFKKHYGKAPSEMK